jgi:CRISPR-associated protein Csc2
MPVNSPTDAIDFPDQGFIDEYSYYMTRRPSVTIAVERDVVDPLLIRNTEDDQAETQEINGSTRAQSNPEKFISKERLTGLDLLRQLDADGSDDDTELISGEYAYNEPPALEDAINMDTLTYGATGTSQEDYGIKSRITAGYTYTLGTYEILNAETRNAVYESGTMKDSENEQSQALYQQVRVQPDNEFVHFLTLEAGTPAMLAYVLHNVLNTFGYGARETRSGKTIQNQIRALVLADNPVMLSVGEFLSDHDPDPNPESVGKELSNYLAAHKQANWSIYGDGEVPNTDDFPEWFTTLKAVAGRQRGDATDILTEMFRTDTEAATASEDGIPGIGSDS